GGEVGVVVAHRAVELGEQFHGADLAKLAPQAVGDVGQFLADGGGGGGLAVGAGHHRHRREGDGHVRQGVGDPFGGGEQDLVAAGLQHQPVGGVVDVLGGAGEVDELGDGVELGIGGDAFLDEVLHRLDVVVGGFLDVLDALGVRFAEAGGDVVEQGVGRGAEGRHLGDAGMGGETLQPADLDDHPVFDQAKLTENLPKRRGLGAVAAVDGGNGGEGGEIHGSVPIGRLAGNERAAF